MLPSMDENKGNPEVVSDTEGEEITPDNPETVKQFPVDTNDPDAVEEVEGIESVNEENTEGQDINIVRARKEAFDK